MSDMADLDGILDTLVFLGVDIAALHVYMGGTSFERSRSVWRSSPTVISTIGLDGWMVMGHCSNRGGMVVTASRCIVL